MSNTPMAAIEALRVDAVQLSHPDREIRVRRFDKQMVVVVHQAVAVAQPMLLADDFLQGSQQCLPIGVIDEDRGLRVAAGGDVVDGAWEIKAERSGHDQE
jgi:hypothetical protein